MTIIRGELPVIKKSCLIIMILAIAGCVSQHVSKAVGVSSGDTICVVTNPSVRQAFHDAYILSLEKHGFKTRSVDPSETNICPFTSEYTARYGMHWGLYLAVADLKIIQDGVLIGRAQYRAPRADMTKHGRVQGKVDGLVKEMFSQ
jgi:hypothetical protein